MVDMIRSNYNQQTEILFIIGEIMSLGAFNNKAEAESSFRKIMNDINQKVDDIDTVSTLIDWTNIAWIYVKGKYLGE